VVVKRFTQTGIIFPAVTLVKELFKSPSQNDRPNDFLSLSCGHIVVSAAAAVGPSPAASVSASEIGLAVLILVALCPVYPAELGSTSPTGLSWQKHSNQSGNEGKHPASHWTASS